MLKYDSAKQVYNYNQGYELGIDFAGTSSKPKFSAVLNSDPTKGIEVIDPSSKTSLSITPKFDLVAPRQDQNRLIYPLTTGDGAVVDTANAAGIKEDIVLNKFQSDSLTFKYDLNLSSELGAKIENDGRLSIYGPEQVLLGNISTGSKADEQLLQKAREHAQKTNLLYTFPAPYVKESYGSKSTKAFAEYKLNGKELTVEVKGLKDASYPLSIDPSVYVESAAKFMRGNNETNIDFDTTNELIDKGVLTGARYESWNNSTALNANRWNAATVVAGGYIYEIGGSSGTTNFGNVYWAKLNTSTNTIDSPDPGSGACTNWCTNSAYDLPGAVVRRGLSAVAYNGYLFAIGGNDAGCAGTNAACGTVYYAKVGANGEPISWTATSSLTVDRFNFGAVVYGNRIYVAGGQTDAALTGSTSVESATINPDGTLNAWSTTGMPDLTTGSNPTAMWGESLLQYNGYIYLVGGVNASSNVLSTVHFIHIKSDGTLDTWISTTAFSTARGSYGGNFSTISGGYMYINGGCGLMTTTNCTSINSSGTSACQGGTTSCNTLGTLITGVGTNWTNALIGDSITYANGTVAVITAVASTTSMTASISQTVAAQTYSIDIDASSSQLASINADGTVSDWTTFTTSGATFYSAGTSACQGATTSCNSNGTLITGVGTTWTSAMVGMTMQFANGVTTLITAFTSTTSLTGSGSQTVAAQAYTIKPTYGRIFGHGLVSWRNTIYSIGGCSQPTASSNCTGTLGPRAFTNYAKVKTDGDVSPKTAEANSLPTIGNASGQVGGVSATVVVYNGYIYNIGGCTNTATICTQMSDNGGWAPINADGTIGTWTVTDSVINTTTGLGAAGSAVYNGYIYMVGGTDGVNGTTSWSRAVYRCQVAANHSLNTCVNTSNTTILPTIIAGDNMGDNSGTQQTTGNGYGMMGVFVRSSAGTSGSMYIVGGCWSNAAGIGCGSIWYTKVLRCTISHTDGSLSGCDGGTNSATNGQNNQLQLPDINANVARNQGVGAMAYAMWGDYLYLVGGVCGTDINSGANPILIGCDISSSGTVNTSEINKVYVAKIDSSGNVVKATINANNAWQIASNVMPTPRRRGVAFTVNGYLYAAAGHDGTTGGSGTLSDIVYSKIDPTTGDLAAFATVSQSGSTNNIISARWGHGYIAANGYLYFLGGCTAGAPAGGCTNVTTSIESIQVYNNYSGSPKSYGATTNLFTTDRLGGSATVYNGYIYIAGGCSTTTDCTTYIGGAASDNQYALLGPDGNIGSAWSNAPAFPGAANRAHGCLVAVGGYLYYMGGRDGITAAYSTVYYSLIGGSGLPGAWSTASGGIGDTAGQAAQAKLSPACSVWNNKVYVSGGSDATPTYTATVYATPSLAAGGNIAVDTWTAQTSFTTARNGAMSVAYGGTLYVIGGFDSANYLIDVQYAPIDSSGSVGTWTYSTTMPIQIRQGAAFAANGYIYVFGGRSASATCTTATYIAPILGYPPGSASRYGLGSWSQTNVTFTGARYGVAAAYGNGRAYLLGGMCNAALTGASRVQFSTLQAQPLLANYSLMIDTDTDVFPLKWLMNGVDNGIGAQWVFNYQSSTSATHSWGLNTAAGAVTLGTPGTYTPIDGSGTNTNFARYYYLSVTVDASQAFGYPEDVTRGPTIADLTLEFTSDPSKRLIHGKTFTGGLQQPLDTPF